MNKKVLLSLATAATLTFTSLGAINADAASNNNQKVTHYNQYTKLQNFVHTILNDKSTSFISWNKIHFVLGKHSVSLCPVFPKPEVNNPSVETPKPEVDNPTTDTQKPEVDQPTTETEKPEVNNPSVETEKPEVDKPSVETPKPEVDKPSIETPKPETNKPEIENPQPEEEKPSTSTVSAFEQKVVELTNAERAKQGLKPLTLDVELSKVARIKSQDMRDKNYFDHNSPTYGSPFDMMKKFGISYKTAGENIAQGQRSPEEVVKAWMNSQGHRENIMNANYTHIGIGHVADNNYWTQMFIGK